MKVFIRSFLLLIILLIGCSNNTESGNPFFDEDGNLKENHSKVMQEEWCNHNKGKDFAIEQCKGIWDSK